MIDDGAVLSRFVDRDPNRVLVFDQWPRASATSNSSMFIPSFL